MVEIVLTYSERFLEVLSLEHTFYAVVSTIYVVATIVLMTIVCTMNDVQ